MFTEGCGSGEGGGSARGETTEAPGEGAGAAKLVSRSIIGVSSCCSAGDIEVQLFRTAANMAVPLLKGVASSDAGDLTGPGPHGLGVRTSNEPVLTETLAADPLNPAVWLEDGPDETRTPGCNEGGGVRKFDGFDMGTYNQRPRLMTLIEYSGEDAFTEEEPQLAKTC